MSSNPTAVMVPLKRGTYVGPKESPTLAGVNSCLTASLYGMRRGVWKQESDAGGQRSPKSLQSETIIKAGPVWTSPQGVCLGEDWDHSCFPSTAVSPCYQLTPSQH